MGATWDSQSSAPCCHLPGATHLPPPPPTHRASETLQHQPSGRVLCLSTARKGAFSLPSWSALLLDFYAPPTAFPDPVQSPEAHCPHFACDAAAGEVAEGVQSSVVLQLGLVHLPLASTRSYGGPPLSEQ